MEVSKLDVYACQKCFRFFTTENEHNAHKKLHEALSNKLLEHVSMYLNLSFFIKLHLKLFSLQSMVR